MKVEGRYLFHDDDDDDDDDDIKLDNFIHVFVGQVSALWLSNRSSACRNL